MPEAVKPLPPRCREIHDPLRFSYQPISGWIQEVGISILGFTHYCGKTRDGRFLLCQKTQRKRMIRKLKELPREMRGVGRTSGFGTSMRGCPRYCVGTMPTSASREAAGLLAACCGEANGRSSHGNGLTLSSRSSHDPTGGRVNCRWWFPSLDLTFATYWQLVEGPAERSKSRWLRTPDLNLHPNTLPSPLRDQQGGHRDWRPTAPCSHRRRGLRSIQESYRVIP